MAFFSVSVSPFLYIAYKITGFGTYFLYLFVLLNPKNEIGKNMT